ncbi:protein tramtrack, beta isoform-like isoform X18 [Ostrinia nubilalis]|uniref:protein tramtrack, beta isoform-like isoform X18 n=1 Tax=Ostrinia nubilalis TaxID=29057 RepID=UPI003082552C
MASDEQFSLCWNNFHANMSAGFHGLLSRGDLVDVTLAAEGRLLQAHKLVLSVCSPYFQEMFKMNPTQHPIVFLKDVSHSALRDLLQFMYQGEVNVKQEELASFISTAEQLQVKGLTGNQNEENSSTPSKPKPTSRPGPRSSQQRQSVMTKLETDLDSKPSSTPVAIKRPNRPSIASNNSSSSQSGPAKRKCVDPLEAGPSGSAKEEFVTIPDEDENNAVAPKMEPEFVNESMWDDDEEGANNDDTTFGEDDSNMEMTGFDGSATGDGNLTGSGEGGAVGDAQGFQGPHASVHFGKTKRDRHVLCRNGYKYLLKRTNKDGTNIWRCNKHAFYKCYAIIKVSSNPFRILNETVHNHFPNDSSVVAYMAGSNEENDSSE